MYYISFDLGTGGVKASLYTQDLTTIQKVFLEYPTYYPKAGWHEQRPEDWWNGVCNSSKQLLSKSGISASEIGCIALSGHSCVAVPIDRQKSLLLDQVPIWSDTRATHQTTRFFQQINEESWYQTTGNGFPPPCYTVFKLMWLKEHHPELFRQIHKVLGSKDYINFRLTGEAFTDPSYASSLGVYNLTSGLLDQDALHAAGLDASLFPPIVPSHRIVGYVTPESAVETGLVPGIPVACGGVDNACMALGAVGTENGRVYVSLGSSSWIAVNSQQPIVDPKTRPYVFAHIGEGMFTSAYSIFSGGSSLRWVKETLCRDLQGDNPYAEMDRLADRVPVGANGVIFNPSLAGGTRQDKSVNIKGVFVGIHLGTTRSDLIRAAMEGIALNLRLSLDALRSQADISDSLLFCGGGSKSQIWMQMFANIFNTNIIKTNIDQDAAALGAAAICARAVGNWNDYSQISSLHQIQSLSRPDPSQVNAYAALLPKFVHVSGVLSDLGDFFSREA